MRHYLLLIALTSVALGQNSTPPTQGQVPRSAPDKQTSQPRSSEVSSSRDNIIDLSPPKDDSASHPDAEEDNSDVMETKLWDPHRAEKNIEVGDYYAKQKNYRAAISRYREALEYKPKDAVATYRLAQALEKNGDTHEAVRLYSEYLKILPNGPFSASAKKALEKLNTQNKRS